MGGHYFEKGEHVSENEKLFTLIEVEKVHGIFSVQENDICDIDEKSIVEIEIPALNKKINSRIYEISPMADSQTGNFTIKTWKRVKFFNLSKKTPSKRLTARQKSDILYLNR